MRLLVVLYTAIFIQGLVWMIVVPVFQTPDEQAHFAQLSYMVENKTLNIHPDKNLSLEIATAEEILGTRRDEFGNNKYTYHPEYKNNSPIPSLSISSRITYVGKEAAMYPPLYYLTAAPFYLLGYNLDLAGRIYLVRFWSAVLVLLLTVTAYKVGKIIWEDEIMAISLAGIVGFQPMISFVGAGTHPDNLVNLISSVMILICLLVLKNGLRLRHIILLALLAWLGIQTKQTIFLLLPPLAAIVAYGWSKKLWPIAVVLLALPIAAFAGRWPIVYMPAGGTDPGLAEYAKFRGNKLLFEMWPWFWGVFKWLGVVLPRLPMQIVTRVAGISLIGATLRLFQKRDFEFKTLVFFLLSATSYGLYLFLWDWRLMQSVGYSHGLQGRYLFVVIVPIMGIFLTGFSSLFGRFKKVGAVLLAIGMIVLNLLALRTVWLSYY
jgi:4-amino-4-deoxy-L-arabinose transferase-like glycosyltransferase